MWIAGYVRDHWRSWHKVYILSVRHSGTSKHESRNRVILCIFNRHHDNLVGIKHVYVSLILDTTVKMISTRAFPIRISFAIKSLATIPRRAHSSTIPAPQISCHAAVQSFPATPVTVLPVQTFHCRSNIVPAPIIMKNPPVWPNSVPRPRPQRPKTCITADTMYAPIIEPYHPATSRPGREPYTIKR